jgi:integrase/recombinase XerC
MGAALEHEIREYLHHIERVKNYSPHTVAAYGGDLLQFHCFLARHFSTPRISPAKVDHVTIRLFLGDLLENGKSRKSIVRKLSSVRSLFDFMVRRKVIAHNPGSNVLTPRLPRKLPVFLDEPSIEKMMNLPDSSTFAGLRDRAILELLYGTGMRLSELVGLDLSSLDLGNNTLKVLGKGSKERIVPIGRKAKDALKAYLAGRAEGEEGRSQLTGAVFVTPGGKRIYARAVYRIVNHYISAASDVRKKSPHVLRHTFATHMVNRGADLRAVKELLGHESLSTTQLYTHVTVDRLKRIYKQAHPKAQ